MCITTPGPHRLRGDSNVYDSHFTGEDTEARNGGTQSSHNSALGQDRLSQEHRALDSSPVDSALGLTAFVQCQAPREKPSKPLASLISMVNSLITLPTGQLEREDSSERGRE